LNLSPSDMLQTISIKVTGKVQGVFYRQSTKETAIKSGITGEVRNMADGRVHIIAKGTKEQLTNLVEWCRKGPKRAVVTNVVAEDIALMNFSSFKIVT
jgi:acylphosphatase